MADLVPIDKRAYVLTVGFLEWIRSVNFLSEDKWIVRQVSRSVASVGANLVEAKSSGFEADFVRYYRIALRSANESKYWLCLIRDVILKEDIKVKVFIKELDEISKIIAKSIISLKSKQ